MNLIEITNSSIKTDEREILIESITAAKIFEESLNLTLAEEKEEIYVFFETVEEKNNIKKMLDIHFENKSTLRKMTLWEHIVNDFIVILIIFV